MNINAKEERRNQNDGELNGERNLRNLVVIVKHIGNGIFECNGNRTMRAGIEMRHLTKHRE